MFIVLFSTFCILLFSVVMLPIGAFGITEKKNVHIPLCVWGNDYAQSCAESQMHTNGLWKYTDMQRGSARRWAVWPANVSAVSHMPNCIPLHNEAQDAQKLLIHKAVKAMLKEIKVISTNFHFK